MKKILSLLLASTVVIGMTGCNVKTKNDVKGNGSNNTENAQSAGNTSGGGIEVRLLGMSASEKDLNVIRDQLSKVGYNVKLNIQPDYGSYTSVIETGNYDLAVTSWTTVTGNPDYAVRSLFTSNGDYNQSGLSDAKVDELIEKASTETSDKYVDTYKELEKVLVEENAYFIPLYSSYKSQAFNKERLNPQTVGIYKSASMPWAELKFNDESLNKTSPFITSQTMPSLTSLDPIKGNDGSINIINSNMYIRLVNLSQNDEVTTYRSLSHNYAIAEGNKEYYFLLRDDVNFASVDKDKNVVVGDRVGAEDVVFSLERAKDKNSVPDHRTYSLHSNMDTISIVTSMEELENTKLTGSDNSVKDELGKGLEMSIQGLVADKNEADNKKGIYQVVKVTTVNPFPQVLNYLCHQSAGIVSKDRVNEVNTYDIETYDKNKDVAYGDQSTITEGATYNNTLAVSGAYILVYKNDYEAKFVKNPGYMPGTKYEANIDTVICKFIKDADSSLSALRSGETDLLYGISEDKYSLIEGEPKLTLQKMQSNAVGYAFFNLKDGSIGKDKNIRLSILNAISQEELITVYNNNKLRTYSTLTPMVNTGNELIANLDASKEYMNKYLEENK